VPGDGRIKQAERSLSEAAREARINLKTLKKKEEEDVNLESQLYGADRIWLLSQIKGM